MLDTPITRALQAYGIDPMNTPQEVRLAHLPHGIEISQFARDDHGEMIVDPGQAPDSVELRQRRAFFPHPKT